MKIWVRTFDRTKLFKISSFAVDGMKVVGYQNNQSIFDSIILGKYDSAERAIAVLDEIQEQIKKSAEETLVIEMPVS